MNAAASCLRDAYFSFSLNDRRRREPTLFIKVDTNIKANKFPSIEMKFAFE